MDRVVDILESKGLLKDSDGTQIVDLSEYNMTPALYKEKGRLELSTSQEISPQYYTEKKPTISTSAST